MDELDRMIKTSVQVLINIMIIDVVESAEKLGSVDAITIHVSIKFFNKLVEYLPPAIYPAIFASQPKIAGCVLVVDDLQTELYVIKSSAQNQHKIKK